VLTNVQYVITHAHMHAQTTRQPKNRMPPTSFSQWWRHK